MSGASGFARHARPFDFSRWSDEEINALDSEEKLLGFSVEEIVDLRLDASSRRPPLPADVVTRIMNREAKAREELASYVATIQEREKREAAEADADAQRRENEALRAEIEFLKAQAKSREKRRSADVEKIHRLEAEAKAASEAAQHARNLAEVKAQEAAEAIERLRERTLDTFCAVGFPLCTRVIENLPDNQASTAHSRWELPIRKLVQWDDLDFSDVDHLLDGARIGREAFVPRPELDRTSNEATVASIFTAKCFSPLLTHIFQMDDLVNDKVDLLFEASTVVNSRPDQVWTSLQGRGTNNRIQLPLLVHEHKCPKTFPSRRLARDVSVDRIWTHPDTGGATSATHNGLRQVYAYMVTLGLKYGAISTTEKTWFLCRKDSGITAEDDNDDVRAEDQHGLMISAPYDCTGEDDDAVNMAYLAVLLLALTDDDATGNFPAPDSALFTWALSKWREKLIGHQNEWREPWLARGGSLAFIQSLETAAKDNPASDQHSGQDQDGYAAAAGDATVDETSEEWSLPLSRVDFGSLLPLPWDEAYEPMLETSTSSIKRLRLPNGVCVVMKTMIAGSSRDICDEELRAGFENERRVYNALHDLQGGPIPLLVYGGQVGFDGEYVVIATMDGGDSLQSLSFPLANSVREGALAALQRLHAAGYSHGDVALRNFVLCPKTNHVRVIDLARAKRLPGIKVERDGVVEAEVAALEESLVSH